MNARDRHQTLEDLRTELRDRSQELSKELLDLVNDNYREFLGLGTGLKGGEEAVEGVRVGLLGFRREVGAVREGVKRREVEVDGLIGERRRVRKEIALGRGLVEVHERVGELEERLLVGSDTKADGSLARPGGGYSDSEEDDEEEESGEEDSPSGFISPARLEKHADAFTEIESLIDDLGPEHPFLISQLPRLSRIRNTLLLDLSTALRQSLGIGEKGRKQVLRVLGIYRELGQGGEAVEVLKTYKGRA